MPIQMGKARERKAEWKRRHILRKRRFPHWPARRASLERLARVVNTYHVCDFPVARLEDFEALESG